MKQSKKLHNIIDVIFMFLPFIFIALSVFRSGEFDIISFEAGIGAFRSFDFGMSQFLIHNLFNDTTNVYMLLLFDFMIYYMIWKFLDLVYYCLSFIIDFARSLIESFRRE